MKPTGSSTPHHPQTLRSPFPTSTWLVALVPLCAALIQLWLFLPQVAGGRALDIAPWPSLSSGAFRVDSLSLTLGVAWSLAIALAAFSLGRDAQSQPKLALPFSLVYVGVLLATYAREPLLLYLGWEVATVGLWLAVRGRRRTKDEGRKVNHASRITFHVSRFTLHTPIMHLAGLPFLAAILLGAVPPLAPPAGGAAQPWPLWVALAFASLVGVRLWVWLFSLLRSGDQLRQTGATALFCLYTLFVSSILAKALVAAPWDTLSFWLLTLLGTLGLLGGLFAAGSSEGSRLAPISAAWASAVVIGFALSPGSSLVAAGALALLLPGTVWGAVAVGGVGAVGGMGLRPLLLLAGLPGAWLISQGALDLGYGLVAALLLPALMLAAILLLRSQGQDQWQEREHGHGGAIPMQGLGAWRFMLGVVLTLAVCHPAAFPQTFVDILLRPVVGAMAGGVGAVSNLEMVEGLGVAVKSPQGVLLAASPATGVALAVFLAFVALRWLRRFAALIVRDPTEPTAE